jgi:transposase
MHQLALASTVSHPGLATVEREELARLRREVVELRRANEILREASILFAREADRPRTR